MENFLVFDLGGTHTKYGLLSSKGEIIQKNQMKTPSSWQELAREMDKIITQYQNEILGIAISTPGRIDVENGVIYKGGSLPYLHEKKIKKYIGEKYHLHASVVNDGKAVTQAEAWKGNLKDANHGAAITLGTGIGGGILIDGQIHQGRDFSSGEFSAMFTSLNEDSKMFSQTTSAISLIREVADMIGLENKTDGKAVFEVIKSGHNENVNEVFQKYCMRIAVFISNLQAVLDISHVVIGGGISNQEIVIKEINNQYGKLRNKYIGLQRTFQPVTIKRTKFSSDSNLIGALHQLLLELNDA